MPHNPTLLFLTPVYRRPELTRVCLRQVRRVCDELERSGGFKCSVLVAGDDENLETADQLGFGLVEQENRPLGRKWNDLYQAACDPEFGLDADYVVPLGSDDWIDPELILSAPLPADRELVCFRQGAFVRSDGVKVALLKVPYAGGLGIRIIPRSLVELAEHRPCEEHKPRAIDTSVLNTLQRATHFRLKLTYHEVHPYQIVDWKSSEQLNTYERLLEYGRGSEHGDPFAALSQHYDADLLDAMRQVYSWK